MPEDSSKRIGQSLACLCAGKSSRVPQPEVSANINLLRTDILLDLREANRIPEVIALRITLCGRWPIFSTRSSHRECLVPDNSWSQWILDVSYSI